MDVYVLKRAENGWILDYPNPNSGHKLTDVFRDEGDNEQQLRSLLNVFHHIVYNECLRPDKHAGRYLEMCIQEPKEVEQNEQ
jgi:hypothetical protein